MAFLSPFLPATPMVFFIAMQTPRVVQHALFPRTEIAQSIATRFEAQAARHGARPAVGGASRSLTYEELNALAGSIAAAVLDRTGGARNVIAFLLEHDALLPAAVLGILKAAGCFVSLDPGHPLVRNAFILADSGARLLLTDHRNLTAARALAARAGESIGVLNIEKIRAGRAANPGPPASPHDPCLLVYTSGSSGRPKGVCHLHRSLLHSAMIYTNEARLGPEDRMSLLHSMSAIAGATALFGALLNGAAVFPCGVRAAGLDRLAAWIEQERITCFHTVPTLFRRLVQSRPAGRVFPDVRLIRLGGEAVTRTEWLLYRRGFTASCGLLFGLSSTEVLNLRQKLWEQWMQPGEAVLPVGDPVADTDLFLVDPHGAPVAPGEVGEIIARSEFLFSGYRNRPAPTEGVLLVDPVDPRRRLFRTGDLGRFDDQGRLFHVGRVDDQVKIHGYRVETAEVEQALRRIPSIQDAAVAPRRRGARETRLVAFIALGGGAAPERRELHARLGETLPEHMVPSAFVFLDALPLLPGGKIDRRTLADRAGAIHGEHVEPRNPVEETLVEIWQRALGVGGIGVEDDLFLDLGGDSLAAVQILAEVDGVFHRALPLSALHEATTVAALARGLGDTGGRSPQSGLLVVHPGGSRPPLFGVCGAFGHALRLLLVGRALGEEQPFYGLQPPRMDWEGAGCRTIEAMAAHYRGEIRRLQPRGPYRLLGTSFGGIVAFEIALQLQRAGEEVALLAMLDTAPPDLPGADGVDRAERFDWAAGMTSTDPLVAMGIRVAHAHRAALDRYLARERFDGTITYFRCAEPPTPDPGDRRLRWASLATGGQRVLPVPGRHGHFHREPQFSVFVSGLRSSLEDVTSVGSAASSPQGAGGR